MFNSFRVRLAFIMATLLALTTSSLSWMLGAAMSHQLAAEQGRALDNLARGIAAVMAEGMDTRLGEIARVAQGGLLPMVRSDGSLAVTDADLDRIAANRTHYSWIGVARPDGVVVAATGHLLVGANVSERPWFAHGLQGLYTGDVHKAKLLAAMLAPSADGSPPRFIDFAAPLTDPQGRVVAVIGAHVNWDWGREVISLLRTGDARQQGVRVFVVDAEGQAILHPPDADRALTPALETLQAGPRVLEWQDGTDYLTAAISVHPQSRTNQLGWRVVVRQPAAVALAAAYEAQRVVWWSGLVVALLAAAVAWWAAGSLSRPLTAIHEAALRIGAGEADVRLPTPSGASEVRGLGTALAGMMATLAAREASLREANETLEARVAERTQALAHANAELNQLARRDALTGLPNRRAADERLASELSRHRRNHQPLTLLGIDIDHFKRVNDTHGHAAGDATLVQVAQLLQRTLRSTDFVARTGGEEFLVLLPETDTEGGQQVAEKLRAAVEALTLETVGSVTISVGMTNRAHTYRDGAAATHAADVALYAAKRGGRNRVVAFEDASRITDSVLDAFA
ncbi:diguanylate cyclase [Aquincola tertiaricarbonis]|uniref:diguanylate cyclase n=1 Tax=Aquincola tertiaricarbonis TaxID=391953 RepID=A0ABY4S1A6_AQUTE|nr:diguanylate cyclase [Aquincola tertiaricarbonis]URI07186.1 diguanylate cyclase [Aquincola tertiaricarbonis]